MTTNVNLPAARWDAYTVNASDGLCASCASSSPLSVAPKLTAEERQAMPMPDERDADGALTACSRCGTRRVRKVAP